MYIVGGWLGNWLEGTFGDIPGVQSDLDIVQEAPTYERYDETRWLAGSTTTTTEREPLVYTRENTGGLVGQLGEAYNEASNFVGGVAESIGAAGQEIKEWSDLGQQAASESIEASKWTIPATYGIMAAGILLMGLYLIKK